MATDAKTDILRIQKHVRCKEFYQQLEQWKNTVALRDVDRVHVLCDILEFLFGKEDRDRSWDDYWLSLKTYIKVGEPGIFTTNAYVRYFNARTSNNDIITSETVSDPEELRDSAIALLRICPLDRNIRYIEEIIADGMGNLHFSLEKLVKYSEKYNRNMDDLFNSVNKGSTFAADTIINALTPAGLKNLMERLHESPNHNTGGEYRGEV